MTDPYDLLLRRERIEREQLRKEERAAFVKDIETHLADIVKDAGKVGKAFEDWNNQLERKQIDGDAIKSRLCDVSNLLDDIYNELRGL